MPPASCPPPSPCTPEPAHLQREARFCDPSRRCEFGTNAVPGHGAQDQDLRFLFGHCSTQSGSGGYPNCRAGVGGSSRWAREGVESYSCTTSPASPVPASCAGAGGEVRMALRPLRVGVGRSIRAGQTLGWGRITVPGLRSITRFPLSPFPQVFLETGRCPQALCTSVERARAQAPGR